MGRDELIIDDLIEEELDAAGGLGFVDRNGMHDALHKLVDKVHLPRESALLTLPRTSVMR